jgi:hypothetical protein
MRYHRSAVLLSVLLVSACGKSPTAPSATFAGGWNGTFESGSDGPGTITMHLDQMDLQITGTAQLSQDGFVDVPAMVTGTLASASSPTTAKLVVTYAYGPFQCQGSFTATLNITSRELDGPFSGENCVRTFVGSLHAVKSN